MGLLEDYKAYYQARMKRYENSPLYKNSYQSEKALSDAMNSCQQLEEFRDKIQDLNIKNAIALVKDKALARVEHFTELKETVRARPQQAIVERIDSAKNENEVVTIVSEEEQKSMAQISIDEFTREFYSSFKLLEDIQSYEEAEVPSKYKDKRQKGIERDSDALRESFRRLEEQANDWVPGWKFDFDQVFEERHRRLIPVSDDVIRQRVTQLKKILGY